MSTGADATLRQADSLAYWLDQQGEHKRANDVRALCRSLVSARTTLSHVHRDYLELRRATGNSNP